MRLDARLAGRRIGNVRGAPLTSLFAILLTVAATPIARATSQDVPEKLPLAASERSEFESTVGLPARLLQVVLPGPLLEADPWEDASAKIVCRILKTYPHGEAHRYDIEYCGYEPGEYDVTSKLHPADGSNPIPLPAAIVTIHKSLPGGRILPNPLSSYEAPRMGGYRWLMMLAPVAWIVGLWLIWSWGRRPKAAAVAAAKPVTLADRLRPLVQSAMAGDLPDRQRAELERLLLNYWRKQLGLNDLPPVQAFARMREHAEAGPLLERLESWLHRPESAATGDVDLQSLLAPYRNVRWDEESEESA